MSNTWRALATLIASATVLGCSGAEMMTATRGNDVVVLDVVPNAGATAVDPGTPITIAFNHPMMAGMEALVVLHEGSLAGPTITGVATWSADRTRLSFAPSIALKHQTTYVLHLSPNLTDAEGRTIDFAGCAGAVGGHPASGGVMGGSGMMGGGNGMMGSGWTPGSGTWGYGMTFTFTTA